MSLLVTLAVPIGMLLTYVGIYLFEHRLDTRRTGEPPPSQRNGRH
jgi:hypothetical protein